MYQTLSLFFLSEVLCEKEKVIESGQQDYTGAITLTVFICKVSINNNLNTSLELPCTVLI